MTCLASEIRSTSFAVGSPVTPKNFFWNEPRWSNARMYRGPSYPSSIAILSFRQSRSNGFTGLITSTVTGSASRLKVSASFGEPTTNP